MMPTTSSSIKIKAPEAPVTEPQINFLRSLAAQNDVIPGKTAEECIALLEQAVAAGLTKGQASEMIARSKAAPRRETTRDVSVTWSHTTGGSRPPAKKPSAEPGYYVLEDGTFIVLVKNRAGTKTYAKKLVVSDSPKRASWEYAPGLAYKATGEPLTLEKAAEFGHLHGICFKCCKPLTDPESVRAGMGPVCRKALAR